MRKYSLLLALVALCGCATRELIDRDSGLIARSTVPIWSTRSALAEFTVTMDTNGLRTVKVTGFSQENSAKLEKQIEAMSQLIAQALAAYAKSQTGGF